MIDLVVPRGLDSETLISAATGLNHDSLSVDERDWSEWVKKRENKSKSVDSSHAAPKDSISPLLKMVREAEEEEDQWLQSLRDALGTVYTSESETTSDSPNTPSILDALAAAPTSKAVSRRASSHISDTPVPLGAASKSSTAQNVQKKRSSVISHSTSSSSIASDGKSSGSGKEVKSFFENFLTPGSGPATSSSSQKK